MGRIDTTAGLKSTLEEVMDFTRKAIGEERLSVLERDIVLEKLRNIYEAFLTLDFEVREPVDSIVCPEPKPDNELSEELLNEYSDQQETPEEKKEVFVEAAVENATQVTMEDLLETPALKSAGISRDIIESLYGANDLCRKKAEVLPEPEVCEQENNDPVDTAIINDSTEPLEQVLNEVLSNGEVHDVASMLSSKNASQLKNIIGLNDRLMLMNDLFGSDSRVFESAIDKLDRCDNIDDAFIYLYENFTIDDSRDGVKLLISLLEKKFG